MKRYLAALAIGGVVFGTVLASAADLGTITDGKLGSATGVVQTCQASGTISADYNVSWDVGPTSGTNLLADRYEVTAVELNGLTDTCNDKKVKVALVNTAGTKVAESVPAGVTVAHVSGKQLISVSGTNDNATALEVTGIRVTIYGE